METIIAISATIISLIALVYSIFQGKLSQKHNRLSTRPILNFSLLTSSSYNRHSLIIENNGLGPALVKDYKFYIDNIVLKEFKKVKSMNNWEELSSHLLFPNNLDWHYLNDETILKVGDKIELVSFGFKNYSSDISSKFRQAVRNLKYEIEYTSVYEIEKFKISYVGIKEIQEE